MKEIYGVMYSEEKGGYSKIKATFVKPEDAEKASEGFGFWGSNGTIIPMKLYEDYDEYRNDNDK
jgi:hypothetical protein